MNVRSRAALGGLCALLITPIGMHTWAVSILEGTPATASDAGVVTTNFLARTDVPDVEETPLATWSTDEVFSSPSTGIGTNATPPSPPSAPDIDALLDGIRRAYEHSLPPEVSTPAQIEQFMHDVRLELEAADLVPPLDPDAYRTRRPPVVAPADEGRATVRVDEDSSITLGERDGEQVYTVRDAEGNIVHEGTLESREDRENIPIDVWKELYQLEREKMQEALEKESQR